MTTEERGNQQRTYRRRFGFWLRMARERAGMTQTDLAVAMGLSKNSTARVVVWERGDTLPSPDQIEMAAAELKVPVDLLIRPEPTAYERIDELVTNPTRAEQPVATAEVKPTTTHQLWVGGSIEPSGEVAVEPKPAQVAPNAAALAIDIYQRQMRRSMDDFVEQWTNLLRVAPQYPDVARIMADASRRMGDAASKAAAAAEAEAERRGQ